MANGTLWIGGQLDLSGEIERLLIEAGILDDAKLREAQAFQRNRGRSLAEAVLEMGLADEATIYRQVAKASRMPFVDLSKGRVPDRLVERIPEEFAVEQRLVPVAEKGGKLVVAVDDPARSMVADQLRFMLSCEIVCAIAAPSALGIVLEKYYGSSGAEQGIAAGLAEAGGEEDGDAPIIRLVTRMFQEAMDQRSSDIHIEPAGDGLVVRYRIDGVLKEAARHPAHLAAPLVSRLKIMGRMDIAEKRKPQDGRIGVKLGTRDIDVRISILPTNHGETIVMRLLDRSANLISLGELGLVGEGRRRMDRMLDRSGGIVLVTGPTGSGKTTTLYAALKELNRPDVKIITAEDPVEYHISGINQVQVNDRVGLSFSRILRAMLRCAPNVILVGEIRDQETAETAIQAALTGHLVFSTLHTNDAPSALTRLVDMGVPPFLCSTAVQAILAQRLVRKLCAECSEEYDPPAAEVQALGLTPRDGMKFRMPRGCYSCEGSGFRGRLGLFEFLELDHDLRERFFEGCSQDELRSAAHSSGKLLPLLEDGASKVLDGATTFTEVLRVCRAGVEEVEVETY
ncbi:MAG: GspE/PulE family protein [Planctomycetota bacterium]|nr:GspE/PulE family protein [Planctomycetota bacterium]MDG2142657.1 GspE/PulE family protein [Planctomycetota bacterium]